MSFLSNILKIVPITFVFFITLKISNAFGIINVLDTITPVTVSSNTVDNANFLADGTLNINDSIMFTGNTTTNSSSTGTLNFGGSGHYTGSIGNALNPLKAINFNGTILSHTLLINGPVYATALNVQGIMSTYINGPVTGNVYYNDNGVLGLSDVFNGNVDFQGNDNAILLFNSNSVINGNIISTGGSSTNGSSTILARNNATVNGTIGTAVNPISQILPIGTGTLPLNFNNTIYAKSLSINSNTFPINFNAVSYFGTINYFLNGSIVNANANLVADTEFILDGILNIGDGVTITGQMDSPVVINRGTINFQGSGKITDNIGVTNRINAINLNGAGTVDLEGTVNTTFININNGDAKLKLHEVTEAYDSLNYTAAGRVEVLKNTTRLNTDFKGNDGTLAFYDDVTTQNGAISSDNNVGGIIEFNGNGGPTPLTFNGLIGVLNGIKRMEFNGSRPVVFTNTAISQNIYINNDDADIRFEGGNLTGNANYTSAGTLNIGSNFTSKILYGNVDFAGKGGTLNFSDGSMIGGFGVDGNIDSSLSTDPDMNGVVNFAGFAFVKGTIGATNPLTALNFNGPGTLNFNKIIKSKIININDDGVFITVRDTVTSDINFTAHNGTFTIYNGANVDGKFDSTGGDGGTIEFLGNGTISNNIGETNFINNLKLSGGGYLVDLQGAILNIHNVNYNDVSTLKISNGNEVRLNGTFTGAHINDSTLDVASNLTVTDPSVGNIGNIIIEDGKKLTIDATNGDVDLLNNNHFIDFTSDNTFLKLLNPSSINQNRTFFFHNPLSPGGGVDLQGNLIVSSNAIYQKLTVHNSGSIGINATTRLNRFIIEGPGQHSYPIPIYAKHIYFNGTGSVDFIGDLETGINGSLNFNNSLNVKGNITGENTYIKLNNNIINYQGFTNINGDTIVDTVLNNNFTYVGNIVVSGVGNTLKFSDADSFKIIFDANNVDVASARNKRYDVFRAINGATINNCTNIDLVTLNGNRFIEWTYEAKNSNLTILGKDITPQVINEIFTYYQADPELAQTLTNINNIDSENTAAFFNILGQVASRDGDRALIVAAQRLITAANVTGESFIIEVEKIMEEAIQRLDYQVSVNTFNPAEISNVLPEVIVGTASGDDQQNYGIWISPFINKADQKVKKLTPGYRTITTGTTVGFDTKISDYTSIGVAYSNSNSTIKYNGTKTGDKTKVNSHYITLYGSKEYDNNWYVNGLAALGINNVNNFEIRNIPNQIMARAKYKGITFGFQGYTGYNYKLQDNIAISPIVGVNGYIYGNNKYHEYGAGKQNAIVKTNGFYNLELETGVQLAKLMAVHKWLVMPEVHAGVSYDVLGQTPKVSARYEGLTTPLPSRAAKPNRWYFLSGSSITTQYKDVELGISYDMDIGTKYLSQQATLKFQLNF